MNAVHTNMSALTGKPGISCAVESPPRTHNGSDTTNTAKKKVHGKPGHARLLLVVGLLGMGLAALTAEKVGECGWSPQDNDKERKHNYDGVCH